MSSWLVVANEENRKRWSREPVRMVARARAEDCLRRGIGYALAGVIFDRTLTTCQFIELVIRAQRSTDADLLLIEPTGYGLLSFRYDRRRELLAMRPDDVDAFLRSRLAAEQGMLAMAG